MKDDFGKINFKNWRASYIPQILKELYIDRVYAPYFKDRKDLTVLDLGANIGLFSLYASEFSKQIYAFEPSKESFDLALQNLKDNNVSNVKLFQEAIAKDDGTQTLYKSTNTTANSLYTVSDIVKDKSEQVKTLRMDTMVKREGIEHIDFMKMDIEGSECEVIGGEGFEKIVPILDAGVCEYHAWSGVNVQQLVTTLRDYGYEVNLIPSEAVILGFVKKNI